MTLKPVNSDGEQASVESEQLEGGLLPYGFAKRHGVLIEPLENGALRLTYRSGIHPHVLLELHRRYRQPLKTDEVSSEQFDALLSRHYEDRKSVTAAAIGALDNGGLDAERLAAELAEPRDLLEAGDDAPIIRLIDSILSEAIRGRASDIHIEPFEGRLLVRFRIDGVLREMFEPPRTVMALIISRIKIMARLDIAEKRLPQDGRISLRIGGRAVDVRVSTLPSSYGERIVLRLLDKQAGRLDLDQIGIDPGGLERIANLISVPNGILLVTGPTGSGKTTTLYAMLTRLNEPRHSILTVEDPIEYNLDGIGQTQVNPQVELSFARGLRAILRQDPDIVMIGEIRDLETAEISVQASLTGHLVLSTLHTNSAIGAITRLRDMGVEPFLLSSSLIGIISQRLVRLLCLSCRLPQRLKTPIESLQLDVDSVVYQHIGCKECGQTGYRGRSGIYEVVMLDDAMRELIHNGASERQIEEQARKNSDSIITDGRRRVLDGVTSVDEVLRVVRE